MTGIPELERHCNSWVAVDRNTGEAVFETFSRNVAEKINQQRYEVLTALQWLCRFNESVKNAKV
jgi:hypothetical protein